MHTGIITCLGITVSHLQLILQQPADSRGAYSPTAWRTPQRRRPTARAAMTTSTTPQPRQRADNALRHVEAAAAVRGRTATAALSRRRPPPARTRSTRTLWATTQAGRASTRASSTHQTQTGAPHTAPVTTASTAALCTRAAYVSSECVYVDDNERVPLTGCACAWARFRDAM